MTLAPVAIIIIDMFFFPSFLSSHFLPGILLVVFLFGGPLIFILIFGLFGFGSLVTSFCDEYLDKFMISVFYIFQLG